MNKKYIVLGLLLILVGMLIAALAYYRRLEKLHVSTTDYSQLAGLEPNVTIRPKITGRGQDVSTNDTILYQFPVGILSEPNTDIGVYSVRAFAFEDLSEFTLLLGPEDGSLMFGTCSFTKNGEITSEATWSVTSIPDIIKEINTGKTVLVRIGYPVNNSAIDQRYKDAMKENIDAIRNNKPVQMIAPLSLCIENNP